MTHDCRDSDKDQKGLAKFIHKKDDFLGRVFYLLQVSVVIVVVCYSLQVMFTSLSFPLSLSLPPSFFLSPSSSLTACSCKWRRENARTKVSLYEALKRDTNDIYGYRRKEGITQVPVMSPSLVCVCV